jgi:tRNA(Ile)-lysidine synthase
MPPDLFPRFRDILLRDGLWRPGEAVLVAVSGGPDSTCLLDLFLQLRAEREFPLGVAHLNHSLRGEESDADEAFVADLARRAKLPFHLRRLAPGSLAGTGEGLEGAARRARLAFLRETAAQHGIPRVALGHTRDDQAETLLLRLLRGAGSRGLSGIRPQAEGIFIRPLLDVSRAEVEAHLAARGRRFRVDSTNADLTRTRNRVRHRLLPFLRREFPGEIDALLARTAEILRAEDAYLDEVVRELGKRLIRREEAGSVLSVPALRLLAPALRRRLLRRAFEEAAGSAARFGPVFDRIEDLERLVFEARHGAAVALPGGLTARVVYSDLVLTAPGGGGSFEGEVPLPVPGATVLPGLGCRLRARHVAASRIGDPRRSAAPDRALLDADTLPGPLAVRARRPGDRFRPLGSPGEAKLKSFLIDRKVPKDLRDRIPLVVSGERIAWVVGHAIEDRFKVTGATRRVVILSKEMV